MSKFFSKCKRLFIKIVMSFNQVKAAKMMGVNILGNIRIDGRPNFETEPWLITIEDKAHITGGVTFMTHDGSVSTIRNLGERFKKVQKFGTIHIKKNAFIGHHAYIMPNITIGENSVVGARSVVTKDVPDNMVVAGVPAKIICTTQELAEKFYNNTPDYEMWKNEKEKKITSAIIADSWRQGSVERKLKL